MFENILHAPRKSVVHDAATILFIGVAGLAQLAGTSAVLLEVVAAGRAGPPVRQEARRAPIERFVVCLRSEGQLRPEDR